MILIRFILISLIIYLLARSFVRYWEEDKPSKRMPEPDKGSKINSKGISKEVGEYIDYEEVDK